MVALVFLAIHRVSSGVLTFDDTLAIIQLLNQSGIVYFMRDALEKSGAALPVYFSIENIIHLH